MKVNKNSIVTILLLIALTTIPRLIGINLFATVDEPYWLTAGSNFYYALGQREFANTVYDYHPAVTTMWVVAAGAFAYFPQYRGLGQGYFDVYKDSLDHFLYSHNHTPLGLLSAGRIVQVILITILLLLTFWFLRRLLGDMVAVTATLLISFDPFFLGHSRLLNHEGMLALFVIVSLLSMLAHVVVDRNWGFLIVSGAAAGFAQLTKSSSFVLLPIIGSLFVLGIFLRPQAGGTSRVRTALIDAALWLLTLATIYVAFWPGMWVSPGRMLQEVFGNALSYAFSGSRLSAVGEQSVPYAPRLNEIVLYVQSILWRTTPVTWIGTLLALGAFYREGWRRRIVLASVVVMGFLFILLFGIASGRNSAHYVMTSYVALNILAAVGLADVALRLASWLPGVGGRLLAALLLASAIIFQARSAIQFFPYYYTYYSPIMESLEPGRQNPNFGYGEGLDLAASYLNAKPEAQDSTVMAFYGRGPFSFFYPGKTEPLKTVYADPENVPQLQQILRKSSYLVLYYALQKGRNTPANLMRALETATPEKTIWLNGIEYIRIYRMASMSPDFYVLLQP